MFNIVLIIVMIVFFWFLTGVRPTEKRSEQYIEGDVELKELSTIWTRYNELREDIGGIGGVSANEPVDVVILPPDEKEEENYDYEVTGIDPSGVIEGISRLINVENNKGECEVFSLNGIVFVHTSGLNRVIRRLKGEIEKEVLREQAKLTVSSLCSEGFTSGFAKYEWTNEEGRTGKSIYLPISSEVFLNKFGLITTDSSPIKSMKLEKRTWNS